MNKKTIGLTLACTVGAFCIGVYVGGNSKPVQQVGKTESSGEISQPRAEVRASSAKPEGVAIKGVPPIPLTPDEYAEIVAIMASRGETQFPPKEWIEHVYRGKIKKARKMN